MILPKYLFVGILSTCLYLTASAQSKEKDKCPEIKTSAKVIHEKSDQKNGEIKLTIKGGQAPYIVQWFSYEFSEQGQHIRNLKAGYYSAVVVDANKCVKQIENIQVNKEN